jgi:hypothetical protein
MSATHAFDTVTRSRLHELGLDDEAIDRFFGPPDADDGWTIPHTLQVPEVTDGTEEDVPDEQDEPEPHQPSAGPGFGDLVPPAADDEDVEEWIGPRYSPGLRSRMPAVAAHYFRLSVEELEARAATTFVRRQGFRYRDPDAALRADPRRLRRECVHWLILSVFDHPAILSWALGGPTAEQIANGDSRGQLNAIRSVIADYYPHLSGTVCADLETGHDARASQAHPPRTEETHDHTPD